MIALSLVGWPETHRIVGPAALEHMIAQGIATDVAILASIARRRQLPAHMVFARERVPPGGSWPMIEFGYRDSSLSAILGKYR